MKLKTFFINRGILLNDFQRFGWLGACYLLVLLFTIPLKIFMLYSRPEDPGLRYAEVYARIFQFDPSQSFLHLASLILVPVLTGLLLFRYLQDSRAADMIHALPIRRETFYNTHVVTGIILLFLPLIFTALISWALVAGLGLEHINSTDIFSWLFTGLLVNLLFFISSVAVGMITGMTVLQGVLSLILLLLPSGLSLLLLHNVGIYLYGFAYDFYFLKTGSLSPLIRLTEISSSYPLQSVEIAAYLLTSIVLYLVGRYLYRRRQIEAAGNALAFDVLHPLFKYAVTFCFMLLLGSYFYQVQGSMAWTYFGYLLGSLLAYFLTEILLNKSLQVFQWRRIRDYGIYALAMLGLIGLFHYDFTGFEKRLPELGNVKSVYLDTYFYPLIHVPAVNTQAYGDIEYVEYHSPVKAMFNERKNIADIYSLHQAIAANRLDHKESFLSKHPLGYENVCLAYELENGSFIYRQYQITSSEYADRLKPIYESLEYKKLHNKILSIKLADVDLIEINAFDRNKTLRLTDAGLIAQAVAALQKDVCAETYEEIKNMDQRPPWAHVTLFLGNNYRIDQDWKKTYFNFEQWLKETGKYNQARLLPGQDFTSAIVDKNPYLNKQDTSKRPGQENLPELENKPGILKITDPEKLELCLLSYNTNSEQALYKVVFLLNNGRTFSGFISEADAPAFIKEHFGF